ncbi:MAG: alginate lyase family protein [Chthoniobacter sp.]|uniref:alginate lyase family protein n=1 Tax=Chthoniobacter sp. TaxID=2510640 RepID=UPI0032A16E7D
MPLVRLLALLLVAGAIAPSPNAPAAEPAAPAPFVHPGLLHTQADLDRMRQRVKAGEEPWKSGFEMLRRDGQSRADWKLRGPFEVVTRASQNSPGNSQMVVDGNAAYQNALMWCVTGDEKYARKATEILDAWAKTLRKMDGRDVQLSAGLNGFKYVNAAELMRYTYPAWPRENVARVEHMLRDVVLPPIQDFATFANGNWDAGCLATMMSIGIFCDDRSLFDRAVDYYRHGAGNGRLTHYVINEAGQCQESGRDQQHTQLGLALLAEACETAWHQGVDLYAEADNRLLKGFEYTAKYNLGNDVPFVPDVDTTGKYRHQKIATEGRGTLRPIYEMVWNHYQNRRGIPAPFTKQAADQLRPEGGAWTGDHPGFGTLLFTLPAKTLPN